MISSALAMPKFPRDLKRKGLDFKITSKVYRPESRLGGLEYDIQFRFIEKLLGITLESRLPAFYASEGDELYFDPRVIIEPDQPRAS